MHGNGVRQTTATTGTGALTLSAVTGFPTLADQFQVGQPFAYSLLDSTGLPLEQGIGHLTSSTAMDRTRVTSTYASSVYDNTSPAAVSLSGTTTVICTAIASSIEAPFATVDSVSSSVGRFLSSAQRTVAFTGVILVLNRAVYTPFLLKSGATINSLAVNVTVLQASSIIKMGIYALGEDGYIGVLLAAAPDVSGATTGFKTATLTTPITLPPGMYVTAAVTSGSATAVTVSCYGQTTAAALGGTPFGFVSGGVGIVDSRYEVLGAGASLPTTPSASTTAIGLGAGAAPAVFMGTV